MEWTRLLKELPEAVQTRNTKAAALRNAGALVSELTAQAITAGAPGPALAKVLAKMEPTVIQERPHACGQAPVVPPLRPLPPQPADSHPAPSTGETDGPARYFLDEAHQRGTVPWKAATMRQYFKQSRQRGIHLPEGCDDPAGRGRRYTEEELATWLPA
ncbi:hypothetical protein [Streptomyces sp. TLI_105]|uniref:hypothetical protein n=1 Tax=Streptomyces sp. TLI_105 TaxID=1881019 RepID=UPI00089993B0|nr:hypothetical protein [Streptomyces sp. TLI_105]SEE62612.1 hypothetical protein SAMN05428939_8213 [Streptomyces sp. TLI_105]